MPTEDDFAILCSGASFGRFLESPKAHGVYVGVNRTASVYPCDYWVFNDKEAFEWYRPQGTPVIVTTFATHKALAEKRSGRKAFVDPFRGYDVLFIDAIADPPPSDFHWRSFSMTMAMVLAYSLKASRISIYGCDWFGNDDWDGTPSRRKGRTPYRWQNEENKYSKLSAWLNIRGISCERVRVVPVGAKT